MNASVTENRITVYEIPRAATRHILTFDRSGPVFAPPGSMPPGRYIEDAGSDLPDGVVWLVSLADLTYRLMADLADVAEFAREYVPDDGESLTDWEREESLVQ